MTMSLQWYVLLATTVYQAIAVHLENRQPPPGQRIDIGGYKLHLYSSLSQSSAPSTIPAASVLSASPVPSSRPKIPTIILDHSLGGIEGYLLIEQLSKLAPAYAYDRAGYGWSDRSPHPRTSDRIVTELDLLLTRAKIEPPYLLVGNSFGSYNMRLYAHRFPEKVVGLVLTDGLHESGMLAMPWPIKLVQYFFVSGFIMSVIGSLLGIIRVLKTIGIFELIKPSLRQFSSAARATVARSFCRSHHWLTMAQELWLLSTSGKQVAMAQSLGNLPLVSIKARAFFLPSILTRLLPLAMIDQLRDRIHDHLLNLSTQSTQIQAPKSDHFVWVEEPEAIINAVQMILDQRKVGEC
ncbi:MAG: alpha/beta hydrolase [Merismopedia sp. SIO2A8]|nr:alpha/beta hydrolase [Merismopedia sp. SIO2A8]